MTTKKLFSWTFSLILGWGLLLTSFIYYSLGREPFTNTVYLDVKRGTTIKQITMELENKGVVRSGKIFYIFYRLKLLLNNTKIDQVSIRLGSYGVPPEDNAWDTMTKLEKGMSFINKISIPEGSNVMDIADILQKSGYDKLGFLRALENRKPKYEFEYSIPKKDTVKFHLEGYLVPVTYNFSPDATGEHIVDDMLYQFQTRYWEGLSLAKNMDRLKVFNGNNALSDWITAASLVQSEGRVRDEFPKIASVIINRLNSSMKYECFLQIDASNLYPFRLRGDKPTGLSDRDKMSGDPYNTYKNCGLPPGPISSPGIAAVKAFLEPDNHDYRYYVRRCNGGGRHNFSRTYAEHKIFVEQYKSCKV